VLLDDQDRDLWDHAQLVEGRQLLERAIARGNSGRYAIQAAIADLHLQQPRDRAAGQRTRWLTPGDRHLG